MGPATADFRRPGRTTNWPKLMLKLMRKLRLLRKDTRKCSAEAERGKLAAQRT